MMYVLSLLTRLCWRKKANSLCLGFLQNYYHHDFDEPCNTKQHAETNEMHKIFISDSKFESKKFLVKLSNSCKNLNNLNSNNYKNCYIVLCLSYRPYDITFKEKVLS